MLGALTLVLACGLACGPGAATDEGAGETGDIDAQAELACADYCEAVVACGLDGAACVRWCDVYRTTFEDTETWPAECQPRLVAFLECGVDASCTALEGYMSFVVQGGGPFPEECATQWDRVCYYGPV